MVPANFYVIFLVLLEGFLADDEADRQVKLGTAFLTKGQYQDALPHFNAALDADPHSFQALFRRATVLLAIGRVPAAQLDLDLAAQLRPDVVAVRAQRGNLRLKLGDLNGALHDYQHVLQIDPKNEDASEKVGKLGELPALAAEVKRLYAQGDCTAAAHLIDQLLESTPWNSAVYRIRADCAKKRGDFPQALNDLRMATKLADDDADDLHYEASQLHFATGSLDDSLTSIRECLKLNQDHKLGYPFYKSLRKIVKVRDAIVKAIDEGDWEKCEKKVGEIASDDRLKTSSSARNVFRKFACKCLAEGGDHEAALAECSTALESEPDDVETLCERAEVHILNDDLDAALADFEAARAADESSERAQKGAERVRQLKANSGRRDYYKILGVKQSASKREITKAYRKLAQKWHPDNFADEKEKKKAEKKFIAIAAAKEVLTDDAKRRRFDQGEDPLESDAHGGHRHHGFPNGFPFGQQGGFNFDGFNFNFR